MTEFDPQNAIDLAMGVEDGDPFEFGGEVFHLTYLSIDAEQKLYKLLLPRMKAMGQHATEGGSLDMAAVFSEVVDLLPEAGAIILGDQNPAISLEWVKGVKGKAISEQLFDLVLKVFVLADLGKMFRSILLTSGMLRALSGL